MGKIDIAAELRKDNKSAEAIDVQVFADALRIYLEAADNVRRNGAICQHPRTGTPIENPYLKVQAQQGAVLTRMNQIRSNRVLKLIQDNGSRGGEGG